MSGHPRLRFAGAACSLLPDGTHVVELTRLVHLSARRVLASVFIVDPRNAASPFLDLVEALEQATWRGVDVRVLIGGSRTTMDIAVASAAGRAVLADRGIAARWLTGIPTRGSHAKFVVLDDAAIVGSHNWSVDALTRQTQDGVVVRSAALAGALALQFDEQWTAAEGDS